MEFRKKITGKQSLFTWIFKKIVFDIGLAFYTHEYHSLSYLIQFLIVEKYLALLVLQVAYEGGGRKCSPLSPKNCQKWWKMDKKKERKIEQNW